MRGEGECRRTKEGRTPRSEEICVTAANHVSWDVNVARNIRRARRNLSELEVRGKKRLTVCGEGCKFNLVGAGSLRNNCNLGIVEVTSTGL